EFDTQMITDELRALHARAGSSSEPRSTSKSRYDACGQYPRQADLLAAAQLEHVHGNGRVWGHLASICLCLLPNRPGQGHRNDPGTQLVLMLDAGVDLGVAAYRQGDARGSLLFGSRISG
ncbi:hypothetical protein, partial [Micromonospora sp. NPDC007230]|uniref:hypothetical protein n=1 Tax=Micromonospora sp. NPDC007230 TaxID=3364237 RepID=UPI0036981A8D